MMVMDQTHLVSSKRNDHLFSAKLPIANNDHRLEEIRPLQSQVAGHSADDGKSSLGMLLHPDGYVLKPAEKSARGENEIRFYEHLKAAVDPVSQELREYVPKFYGTRSVTINGKDVLCIALQNVTEGMLEPCVMDVKIGKQTWEPSASEEKKNIEKAKYAESKREYGFCIPGMQFYDIASHELVRYGKEYGKTLDRNGIKSALKLFLNWSSSISHPIIVQFLCKLWKMMRWFQSQRQFLFYSSSVLFVYDAYLLRNYSSSSVVFNESSHQDSSFLSSQVCEMDDLSAKIQPFPSSGGGVDEEWNAWKNGCFQCCDPCHNSIPLECDGHAKLADVKMIDFAHTLVSGECSGIDSNYIEGLQNLVTIFEALLKESI